MPRFPRAPSLWPGRRARALVALAVFGTGAVAFNLRTDPGPVEVVAGRRGGDPGVTVTSLADTATSTIPVEPATSSTTGPAATSSSTSTSYPKPVAKPTTTTTARRVTTTTTTVSAPPSCLPQAVTYLLDVKAVGPSDVWVAGNSSTDGQVTYKPQVQVSHDAGGSWTPACLGVPALGDAHAVEFISPTDGWAFGSGGSTGSGNGWAFAARTTNGGASWSLAKLPDGIAGLTDVAFVDKNRGFAVGSASATYPNPNGALLTTEDGGGTWRRRDLPVPGFVSAIHFADSRHGVIAGGGPDGHLILRTADGGETWKAASVPAARGATGRGTLRDILLTDADHGFAVGENAGILGTADGGRTWEERLSTGDQPSLWKLSFSDTQYGWAVGGLTKGEVYGTTDGGTTWKHLSTAPGPSLQAVSFADRLHGFAIANQRPCLYSTTDGGVTWTGRRLNGTAACTM